MTTRRFTFQRWQAVAVLVWLVGSAFAAGVVRDDDAELALRLGAAGACWGATLIAPYLLLRRIASMDRERGRVAAINLFLGAFWALAFGLAMSAYYALFGDGTPGADPAVLLFLLPPSAVGFTLGVAFLTEWRGGGAAAGPRGPD